MGVAGSTVTFASPLLRMPSARAAPHERSMILPRTNGPRSLTRTMTERSVSGHVTFRSVPKDSVRWAHVRLSWCSRSPLAVRAPVADLA